MWGCGFHPRLSPGESPGDFGGAALRTTATVYRSTSEAPGDSPGLRRGAYSGFGNFRIWL